MKVSELSGALLDYWVARAEGSKGAGYHFQDDAWHATDCGVPVFYSRNWEQGGPIIERELISTMSYIVPAVGGSPWAARNVTGTIFVDGDTPLIAAMRVRVFSKFGEEVPDEVPA
ncbi:phage protein NinX family protein [Paraburkholderia xenovorans]|jgi:hypothetical protein